MDLETLATSKELARRWKEEQKAEAVRMRNAMEREGGLMNIPQAATFLDVSRQRITELMRLNILSRHVFFGQIYASFDEVVERRAKDLKAGRPKRTFAAKVGMVGKVLGQSNLTQIRHGGPVTAEKRPKAKK